MKHGADIRNLIRKEFKFDFFLWLYQDSVLISFITTDD